MRPIQFGTLYRTLEKSKAQTKQEEWEAAGKQVAMTSCGSFDLSGGGIYLVGIDNPDGQDDFQLVSDLRARQEAMSSAIEGKSEDEIRSFLSSSDGEQVSTEAIQLGGELFNLTQRANDVDPASDKIW
jgi:hypothetical protein